MNVTRRIRLWLAELFAPRGYYVVQTVAGAIEEISKVRIDDLSRDEVDELVERLVAKQDRLRLLAGLSDEKGAPLPLATRGRDLTQNRTMVEQINVDKDELARAVASAKPLGENR